MISHGTISMTQCVMYSVCHKGPRWAWPGSDKTVYHRFIPYVTKYAFTYNLRHIWVHLSVTVSMINILIEGFTN